MKALLQGRCTCFSTASIFVQYKLRHWDMFACLHMDPSSGAHQYVRAGEFELHRMSSPIQWHVPVLPQNPAQL